MRKQPLRKLRSKQRATLQATNQVFKLLTAIVGTAVGDGVDATIPWLSSDIIGSDATGGDGTGGNRCEGLIVVCDGKDKNK